jgi:hypothetical protein
MKIKPSQRPRKRYIVVASQQPNVEQSIRKAVSFPIKVMKAKKPSQLRKTIVRVQNVNVKEFINSINQTADLKTLGMSGVYRKVHQKHCQV